MPARHQAAKEQCSSYRTFYVVIVYFPSLIADCLMLTGMQYGQKASNPPPLWASLDPWIPVKQCSRPGENAIQPILASPGQSGTQAKPLASPRASNMGSRIFALAPGTVVANGLRGARSAAYRTNSKTSQTFTTQLV